MSENNSTHGVEAAGGVALYSEGATAGAAKKYGVAGGAVTATDIPVHRTRPEKLIRHDISDEELEMLDSARRDGLSDAIWGFGGLAGASMIPAVTSLWKAYILNPSVPLAGADQLQVIMFFVGAALTVGLLVVNRARRKRNMTLIEEIRARRLG